MTAEGLRSTSSHATPIGALGSSSKLVPSSPNGTDNHDVEYTDRRRDWDQATKSSRIGDNISIAVDPVALITTECITVTSAMRKHARWAQSSVSAILGGGGAFDGARNQRTQGQLKRGPAHSKAPSQSSRPGSSHLDEEDALASRWGLRGKKGRSMQDNPLMSAFARLRSDLRGCHGKSCGTAACFKAILKIPQISGHSILQVCSIHSCKSSDPRPPLPQLHPLRSLPLPSFSHTS